MDSEIHPRECDQSGKCDHGDTHADPSADHKEVSGDPDGVLRMPGGEGITGRLSARRFDDREIRIQHPRARNTEEELQRLVDERAGKAGEKDIKPFPLVHAPEKENGDRHKDRLFSEMGDQREKGVEYRVTDLFEQTKQSHGFSPFDKECRIGKRMRHGKSNQARIFLTAATMRASLALAKK